MSAARPAPPDTVSSPPRERISNVSVVSIVIVMFPTLRVRMTNGTGGRDRDHFGGGRTEELQRVVADPALDQVVAVPGVPDHGVVARTADVRLASGAGASGQRVVVVPAVQRVEPGHAEEGVVAVPAEQGLSPARRR